MDFPQSSYYKWNRTLLSLVGQWPYQERKTILFRRFIVLLYLTISLITQTAGLIKENFNVDILFGILPIFLTVVLAFMLTFTFYRNSNVFEKLYRLMQEDWAMERFDEELKIKESYAQMGYTITKYTAVSGCVGCVLFVIASSSLTIILDTFLPLNESRPRVSPFNDEYFIDQEKYFYFLLIHANLTVIVIITFFVANQTMFCVHVQHICGMFAVLSHRLEYIIPSIKFDSNAVSRENLYYNLICWCIQCHQKTLEFSTVLETYYSPPYFVVIVIFVLILSPTMVQLSNLKMTASKDVLQFICYLMALFLMSYLGQKLIDISSQLSEKVYFCHWYKYPSQTQRLLLLFIKRCEKPCSISAFNLYLLSLNCFRMVTQTGFSYFMVLKQIQ